jgi:hypothetical protein
MCTFKDERTVQVCDVAIEQVRHELQASFGEKVHYTHVAGEGTIVQASEDVDATLFNTRAQAAIAAAQQAG